VSSRCETCNGSGYEIVPGRGARLCLCRVEAQRKRLIAAIPEKFAGFTLGNIVPDPSVHPKQTAAIGVMRENPHGSYYLAGSPGRGKTMLMWALYREAVEDGTRRVVCCTLSDLLEEYRAVFRAIEMEEMPKLPRLTPEMLSQSEAKYAVFLDDIDKANVTDYVGEQVYRLVNAVYENGHQLVVTTNKNERDLIRQFSKRDESLGEPIVRRMIDGATVVNFF
jgi:DNA replication protein DnaC